MANPHPVSRRGKPNKASSARIERVVGQGKRAVAGSRSAKVATICWQVATDSKSSHSPMPGGGSKPGERRGGRQRGTPNKTLTEQAQALAAKDPKTKRRNTINI